MKRRKPVQPKTTPAHEYAKKLVQHLGFEPAQRVAASCFQYDITLLEPGRILDEIYNPAAANQRYWKQVSEYIDKKLNPKLRKNANV